MEQSTNSFFYFLMIVSGVFIANILTIALVMVLMNYQANVAMKEAAEFLQQSQRQSALMLEQNKRVAEARAKEAAQLAGVRRKNDEVCAYWRNEYASKRTAYNKSYADEACIRAQND